MPFEWYPNQEPPAIDEHSKAKLAVVRSYLRAYLDRLTIRPGAEVFKLDLVDGFSGGGLFRDGRDVIAGTPTIMLEEVRAAEVRLNANRKKPLHFDCKFYFVDRSRAHADFLRQALSERGYLSGLKDVEVIVGPFERHIEPILAAIHRRQPRAGRAIFLLDQMGYNKVAIRNVARIFASLRSAEVLLTFAIDVLANFLSDNPSFAKSVAPLDFPDHRLQELVERKSESGGRALLQRTLRDHLRRGVGATFDTPFFIRPRVSRRALWLVHLSRHRTARDVMIQIHWDVHNTFEHYGSGGFGMLGYDPLHEPGYIPLLDFGEEDAKQVRKELEATMGRELQGLMVDRSITVDAMLEKFGNDTTVTSEGLMDVVLGLNAALEVDILAENGHRRGRSIQRLNGGDRISMPKIARLPGLGSRRRR